MSDEWDVVTVWWVAGIAFAVFNLGIPAFVGIVFGAGQ